MADSVDHPYSMSCGSVELTEEEQNLNLNIYQQTLPKQTQSGASLKDFFSKVEGKIRARIKNEKQSAEAIQACLNKNCVSSKTSSCTGAIASVNTCIPLTSDIKEILKLKDNAKYSFEDLVADARFHLHLSNTNTFNRLVTTNAALSGSINTKLESYDFPKESAWEPAEYKGKEYNTASNQLKSYWEDTGKMSSLDRGADGRLTAKGVKTKMDRMNKIRDLHAETYQNIMLSHPILQHVTSAKPSVQEMNVAAKSVLDSLEKEEDWIDDATKDLQGDGDLSTNTLKLLNYSDIIAETLQEMPEYCGISRDLKSIYDAKDIGKSTAIYLPIMVASFFNPGFIALAAGGVGSAGVGLTYSYGLMQDEKLQITGRVNPTSYSDAIEVQQRKEAFNMEVLTAPLAILPGTAANHGAATASRGILNRLKWTRKPKDNVKIINSISSK